METSSNFKKQPVLARSEGPLGLSNAYHNSAGAQKGVGVQKARKMIEHWASFCENQPEKKLIALRRTTLSKQCNFSKNLSIFLENFANFKKKPVLARSEGPLGLSNAYHNSAGARKGVGVQKAIWTIEHWASFCEKQPEKQTTCCSQLNVQKILKLLKKSFNFLGKRF